MNNEYFSKLLSEARWPKLQRHPVGCACGTCDGSGDDKGGTVCVSPIMDLRALNYSDSLSFRDECEKYAREHGIAFEDAISKLKPICDAREEHVFEKGYDHGYLEGFRKGISVTKFQYENQRADLRIPGAELNAQHFHAKNCMCADCYNDAVRQIDARNAAGNLGDDDLTDDSWQSRFLSLEPHRGYTADIIEDGSHSDSPGYSSNVGCAGIDRAAKRSRTLFAKHPQPDRNCGGDAA